LHLALLARPIYDRVGGWEDARARGDPRRAAPECDRCRAAALGGAAASAIAGLQVSPSASDRRFIADFACTKHRLVIEADGGEHNGSIADDRRTAWLEREGWRVLRFWNNDILSNTEGVLSAIVEALRER
jgi:very-short-patch-repair endonuclease